MVDEYGCALKLTLHINFDFDKSDIKPEFAADPKMAGDFVGQAAVGLEDQMLWTIAVILMILWTLGLVSSYSLGVYIHILLAIALIVMVAGFLQGRRAHR